MSEYGGKYDARDYTGKKIKVGDLVAYPVRRGSDMQMKSARVSACANQIQLYPDSARAHLGAHIRKLSKPKVTYNIEAINDKGRRVLLTVPSRLIVLESNDA